jgi:hypothetical protein
MSDEFNNDAFDDIPDDLESEAGEHDLTENGMALGSAPVDFARMGLNQVAYIRRAVVNDIPVWGIYSASGDTLGAAQTFEQAWGAIKQNNLQPMRVH